MLLLVILLWWVYLYPITMASFDRQRCWLLFSGVFLVFLIAHECHHSFGLLLAYELLCWAIILPPYTPPSEAWFWTLPLQWWWRRRWRLILQRHRTSIPSSCFWRPNRKKLSRIIIRRYRSDSSRRWEHPRDLASTSMYPSMVRLS